MQTVDGLDMIKKDSVEYAEFERRRKDIVYKDVEISTKSGCACIPNNAKTVAKCRQLKEPLTFAQWNQEAINFIGKPYEEHGGVMVTSTLKQDPECWSMLCPCCCKQSQASDSRTEAEKAKAEESVFCSELAAVMIYKGGWRLGSACSDMYLPKDFADDAHQILTYDMAPECEYGPLIEIFLDEESMAKSGNN